MDFNTVIFEGDVEWQERQDVGTHWRASFVPQNDFQQDGTVTLTLNGNDIEGVFDEGAYLFLRDGTPVAFIVLDEHTTQYIIDSMVEPDAHIKIVQAEA